MLHNRQGSLFFRVIFFCITFSLLNHCGFVLKKGVNLSAKIPEISISQNTVNPAFINLLEQALSDRQVMLVDNAQMILNVINYETGRRAASISSSNASQIETQIIKALTFSVADRKTGRLIIGRNTITLHKEYINDNANIAGKAEEELLINEELNKEMIARLFRRLEALPPIEAIRFVDTASENTAQDLENKAADALEEKRPEDL